MANAASGVATTTAGDTGCQVSPSLQRTGTKQHSIFPSSQWVCFVGGLELHQSLAWPSLSVLTTLTLAYSRGISKTKSIL